MVYFRAVSHFPVTGPCWRVWHYALTLSLEILIWTVEISPLSVSSSREDHVPTVWEVCCQAREAVSVELLVVVPSLLSVKEGSLVLAGTAPLC